MNLHICINHGTENFWVRGHLRMPIAGLYRALARWGRKFSSTFVLERRKSILLAGGGGFLNFPLMLVIAFSLAAVVQMRTIVLSLPLRPAFSRAERLGLFLDKNKFGLERGSWAF